MNQAVAEAPIEQTESREARLFQLQQTLAPMLRHTTAGQRLAKLEKLRQAMESHREEIQKAAMADFSKPAAEVELSEIFPVLHEIAHAKRHLKKWMKPRKVSPTAAMAGTRGEVRFEPRGVTLIISPWNYPINLTFGPLVSAIAAGNTAILKPSEMTPHCSALISRMVAELFSEDEVAVCEGEVDVSQRLLALPFDHIFFTGSPQVGRIVMGAAAKHLSSVTLELGGKSPAIVDETANLEKTVNNLVWGKFTNNGQTCIAPDYLLVDSRLREPFLKTIKARIDAVFGASEQAQKANPDYCRIVNDAHFQRLKRLYQDATEKGATVVSGGAMDETQRFIAPTVLTDLSDEAKMMEEEIFGPLLPVLFYQDLDTAISTINNKPKPLALYIFSKNRERTDYLLNSIPAGGSCVNHSVVQFLHGNLPFGGVNNSGIGNSHGYYGFRAFSHEKATVRDQFSITHWLFPPYTRFVQTLIKLTSRFFT
ncbi:MAG: aldehyde dehydrogenase family protein [Oleiphilaceae bacterium]|nr:aldehyde dehydrogenase family protein [Oleiphilaceae bacterium]